MDTIHARDAVKSATIKEPTGGSITTHTIDARDAVKSATDYLDHIKDLMGEKINNLRLEELELSENQQLWVVTLGLMCPIHHRVLKV